MSIFALTNLVTIC